MKIHLKATRTMLDFVRRDLERPHGFAYERVGFITAVFAWTGLGNLAVLLQDYHPVADEDYIMDEGYGALIGAAAFRKAMQIAYDREVGMFHVHLHDHRGTPRPSMIDLEETAAFVPDFFHVRPGRPHGALILSRDSASGLIWFPDREDAPVPIDRITVVGSPMTFLTEISNERALKSPKLSRP